MLKILRDRKRVSYRPDWTRACNGPITGPLRARQLLPVYIHIYIYIYESLYQKYQVWVFYVFKP